MSDERDDGLRAFRQRDDDHPGGPGARLRDLHVLNDRQGAGSDGADDAVVASPTAYSIGSPTVDGNTVSQILQWPAGSFLSGNIYALYLTAVTDFNQSLAAWSRIVIERVA